MSNSFQPHETLWTVSHRLLCTWDSPGKNTGVVAMPSSRGSSWHRDRTHVSFIFCISGRFFTHWAIWEPCESESRSVMSDSLQFSRRKYWSGSLSLLHRIFPTQGSNPGLLHCRQILYPLSHKGSPRILEWVAYPFSSRSSQPRNQTGVSCITGRFFTNWAIREAWEAHK